MKIACINYEPVSAYKKQGWSNDRLASYYNPCNVSDEVRVFAYIDEDWEISSTVKVVGYHSFKELEQKCGSYNPDVIRCYEACRPNCYYALFLAMKLGIPSYLSLHDNRVLYSSVLSEFTAITAYTETLAKKAAAGFGREVEIQLNGVPSEVFRPKTPEFIDPRIASAKNRIFTITRNDPVKNINTMIEATKLLSDKVSSVVHVIAGPGSENIPYDGVHLGLGPLTENAVAEYLNWCNCFLQVQLVSEIGMAASEALMVGRPIIVTGDLDGNAQYVVDEQNGILIPMQKAKDAQYIAEALSTCLNNHYDSAKIRSQAIERYDASILRRKEAERYLRLNLVRRGVKYSNFAKLDLYQKVLRARIRQRPIRKD